MCLGWLTVCPAWRDYKEQYEGSKGLPCQVFQKKGGGEVFHGFESRVGNWLGIDSLTLYIAWLLV
jgi:hypothetical protein